jgi:hypothetical protein
LCYFQKLGGIIPVTSYLQSGAQRWADRAKRFAFLRAETSMNEIETLLESAAIPLVDNLLSQTLGLELSERV